MSPTTPSCPHELRPGTVVCLHCRHEARMAAQARWRRMALRVGGVAAALAGIAAFAASRGGDLAARQQITTYALAADSADTPAPAVAEHHASEGTAALPSPEQPRRAGQANVNAPAPTAAAPELSSAPAALDSRPLPHHSGLTPVVAEGKTELGDGLFVVRDGRDVRVVFDTEGRRTRRRDKFERVVRQTLPRVFGENARSALDRIPEGQLVEPSESVLELTERGLRMAVDGGVALALYPETRPGRDGPLVVSYRATPAN